MTLSWIEVYVDIIFEFTNPKILLQHISMDMGVICVLSLNSKRGTLTVSEATLLIVYEPAC